MTTTATPEPFWSSSRPNRTPEQDRTVAAFTLKHLGSIIGTKLVRVTRTDASVPWPDDATLVHVCDHGWDAHFRGAKPCPFGGRVKPVPQAHEQRDVEVWTD